MVQYQYCHTATSVEGPIILHRSGTMLAFYLSLIDDEVSRSQFEEFYERYRHIMLHVALSVLHDRSLAEDAVHDAFLRIIKDRKSVV